MSEIRIHSEEAWNIAIKYSHVLASETRDLAAHIDVELNPLRERIGQLEELLDEVSELIVMPDEIHAKIKAALKGTEK